MNAKHTCRKPPGTLLRDNPQSHEHSGLRAKNGAQYNEDNDVWQKTSEQNQRGQHVVSSGWILVLACFRKLGEREGRLQLAEMYSWNSSGTHPDFKSVILRQFVASSPTFPLRTTLDMNGESIGEIRFKATSGDIFNLTCKSPLKTEGIQCWAVFQAMTDSPTSFPRAAGTPTEISPVGIRILFQTFFHNLPQWWRTWG